MNELAAVSFPLKVPLTGNPFPTAELTGLELGLDPAPSTLIRSGLGILEGPDRSGLGLTIFRLASRLSEVRREVWELRMLSSRFTGPSNQI